MRASLKRDGLPRDARFALARAWSAASFINLSIRRTRSTRKVRTTRNPAFGRNAKSAGSMANRSTIPQKLVAYLRRFSATQR